MTVHRVLTGRVALVTGASRGIGAACARALAAAGAHVVLAARDHQALHAVATTITDRGGHATVVPTDVRDAAQVHHVVERALDVDGHLDIAINNAAGGGHRPAPLADVDVDEFDAGLATSLRGVFLAMQDEIAAMLRGRGGAIVNMSSTAAQRPVAGLAGYVAAKSAIDGLTRSAALDYAAHGIRINALAPGPVLTDGLRAAGPEARDRVAASLPVRRPGRPEEIAAAAVWLCGPDATFVTGAVVPVDGGLLAGMSPFAASPRATTTALSQETS